MTEGAEDREGLARETERAANSVAESLDDEPYRQEYLVRYYRKVGDEEWYLGGERCHVKQG